MCTAKQLTLMNIGQMFCVRLSCDVQRAIRLSFNRIQPYRFVVVFFALVYCGIFVESTCKAYVMNV